MYQTARTHTLLASRLALPSTIYIPLSLSLYTFYPYPYSYFYAYAYLHIVLPLHSWPFAFGKKKRTLYMYTLHSLDFDPRSSLLDSRPLTFVWTRPTRPSFLLVGLDIRPSLTLPDPDPVQHMYIPVPSTLLSAFYYSAILFVFVSIHACIHLSTYLVTIPIVRC